MVVVGGGVESKFSVQLRPKLNNIFVYYCIKPLNTKDYLGALKTTHERY